MELKEAIKILNLKDTSSDDIVKFFDEEVILSSDTTRQDWSSVNNKFIAMGLPLELVASWNVKLPDLPGGSMLGEMLRVGVNLADPSLQAQMKAVLSQVQDPAAIAVLNALISIGVQRGKNWQKYIDKMPDSTEVQAAIDEISLSEIVANNKMSIISLANTKQSVALAVIDQGGTLEDAIKAFDEAK